MVANFTLFTDQIEKFEIKNVNTVFIKNDYLVINTFDLEVYEFLLVKVIDFNLKRVKE